MIVTALFGKINKSILVNRNYSLKLSNLNPQDKLWFNKVLTSELKEYYKREKSRAISFPHLPSYKLQDLLMSVYYKDFFFNKQHESDLASCMSICNYVISLECKEQVPDTKLYLKNEYVLNPSCEKSNEERFIEFYNFLESHNYVREKSASWRIDYNSHEFIQYTDKSHIISHMHWNVQNYEMYWRSNSHMHVSHKLEYETKVNSLCDFGNKIDQYIASDEDFFVIDYVIELLSSIECFGAAWLIKMTSLLEFVLVRKNAKSIRNELIKKLQQFISDDIADKDHWISLCYDIRSKLAHGDYFELVKKAKEYALLYMKEYSYDFYEHNEISSIISNVGWQMSEIVAKVINTMLNEKSKIIDLKNN